MTSTRRTRNSAAAAVSAHLECAIVTGRTRSSKRQAQAQDGTATIAEHAVDIDASPSLPDLSNEVLGDALARAKRSKSTTAASVTPQQRKAEIKRKKCTPPGDGVSADVAEPAAKRVRSAGRRTAVAAAKAVDAKQPVAVDEGTVQPSAKEADMKAPSAAPAPVACAAASSPKSAAPPPAPVARVAQAPPAAASPKPPACYSPRRGLFSQASIMSSLSLPRVASPHRPLIASTLHPLSPRRGLPCSPLRTTAAATATATTGVAAAPSAPSAATNAQPAPNAPLTDQEFLEIRRLLLPGALAGTLLRPPSVAAASAGNAQPATSCGTAPAEPAGRGTQFKDLSNVVSQCCSTGRGASVYISGLPGTGKTYTVSRLLAALPALASAASAQGTDPLTVSACTATLNCMSIDDPAQLYGRLQEELARAAATGSGMSTHLDAQPCPSSDAAAAHASLVATLQRLSAPSSSNAPSKAKASAKRGRGAAAAAGCQDDAPLQRRVFVVVLDEVDRLLSRRDGGEDLARLFQLPEAPGVCLVLLAVANSLDLTERCMPLLRATCRTPPRHMVFTAYSRPQVVAILTSQLAAHPRGPGTFEPAALDMVAKSTSAASGDLRQALKACRTALDVLSEHNRANPSAPRRSCGMREAHAALQRMAATGGGQPAVLSKIRGLPPQQQLVLLALATAVGSRAAGGGEGGACGAAGQQQVFTGVRAKFADAVAFREIGNGGNGPDSALKPHNTSGCFNGPTPGKAVGGSRLGGAPASTPGASRVRGVTGPAGGGAEGSAKGNATPGGACAGRTPPSRTPASILAGDAGLAVPLPDVYGTYVSLARQLDIPAMSESAFRTDALVGLDCDGLLRQAHGRTPAATRLSLRPLVADVRAALADNVMFRRLLGAKAGVQGQGAAQGAGAGAGPAPLSAAPIRV